MKSVFEIYNEVSFMRQFDTTSMEQLLEIVAHAYAKQFKSEWIDVNSQEGLELLKGGVKTENLMVLFDNGETKYFNEDWPFACSTHVLVVPEKPRQDE